MKFVHTWHAILRLPYYFAFAKLKFTAKLLWSIEVWPRHSFLNDTFIPFKSDLDLTAFVSNRDVISKFLFFYQIMKFCFPFLGEVNIYDADSIQFLKSTPLNELELQRDPTLLERLGIKITVGKNGRAQAASYLMAALINDLHKIAENPASRIKKWRFHIDHVNKFINGSPKIEMKDSALLFSIVTAITNLAAPESEKQASTMRNELSLLLRQGLFINFEENTDDFEWVKALAMQPNSVCWMFFIEYVCHLEECIELPKVDKRFEPLIESQVSWILLRMLRQKFDDHIRRNDLLRIKKIEICLGKLVQKNPELVFSELISKLDLAKKL